MWKTKKRNNEGRAVAEQLLLDEAAFLNMLHVEQKRSERSSRPFVLMLIRPAAMQEKTDPEAAWPAEALRALSGGTRETDIKGWYRQGAVAGIIFTEIPADGAEKATVAVASKMETVLRKAVEGTGAGFEILCYLFPEDWHEGGGGPKVPRRHPDLVRDAPAKSQVVVKRWVDITGSASALVLFSPLFVAVAAAVKLTSKGPVIFRQERLGQHGRPFTFLKFRSMEADNDTEIHRSYVAKLIAGTEEDGGTPVFKLTNDPRVTRVGRFLRRTSLDELPQFWNVLCGDMSLVGPRPPLPYEFEKYEMWHRQRLAVKPGITGLWQVEGRSRVSFAEMIRLDLRYGRRFSIWQDLRILLRTPRAMLTGRGAH